MWQHLGDSRELHSALAPSHPTASNVKKILRPNLSPLQHQFQSIEASRFLGMRAAQRSPSGERSGKAEGRKTKLLDSMGRSITAAKNNAANARLPHQPQHQAAESDTEFLVVSQPRRRPKGRIEHSISPRSQEL
jgi:hypothetical protein